MKVLKWIAIILVVCLISTCFETTDQAAAREKQEKADAVVAAQVESDKLQVKAERQAAKDKAQAEARAAKAKENATSKVSLVTTCQLAIKPQLKNPKSMKLDWHQTVKGEMSTGQLGVRMYYYAENSFGATPLSIVNCLFDTSGNLVEYKQVQ